MRTRSIATKHIRPFCFIMQDESYFTPVNLKVVDVYASSFIEAQKKIRKIEKAFVSAFIPLSFRFSDSTIRENQQLTLF